MTLTLAVSEVAGDSGFWIQNISNIPIPELQKVCPFSCHPQPVFNPAGLLSIICDPLVGKFWGL